MMLHSKRDCRKAPAALLGLGLLSFGSSFLLGVFGALLPFELHPWWQFGCLSWRDE